MLKHCLKCGHANPCATGAELDACPQCGAIYSRVEAAQATQATARASTSSSFWERHGPGAGVNETETARSIGRQYVFRGGGIKYLYTSNGVVTAIQR